MNGKPYHVALSYAGEQRKYVAKVARFLEENNVRCFYDQSEEIGLWGKNLLEAFEEVFEGGQTYVVVIFISQEYVKKAFPRMELRYALAKAMEQKKEYILPARFDSATVPGLPSTTKDIDLEGKTPEYFAKMIIEKITKMEIYLGPDSDTQVESAELIKIPQKNSSEVTFTIEDESGNPIPKVNIYLIHSNGTHRSETTNETGETTFSCDRKSTDFHTIFVAHHDFPARIIDNFRCDTGLKVNLTKKMGRGSFIFDGTGYIPGIEGRLNPILDSIERTYLYANNISVNNNTAQPAHFKYGENISLTDCHGRTADIKIHRIIQGCSILDYITCEVG